MTGEAVAENEPVVIAGAGQAGFSVAAKLREYGYAGPITLIGDEDHPPYQRPPLSKAYLLGEMSRERLYLRAPSFYSDNAISLRLSTSVVSIGRATRTVQLSDGASLPYVRLVLATGTRPRKLPSDVSGGLGGIYYVRSLADIDAMTDEFQPGRRVLVVGGGYIGLEAAAVAAKLGLRVTLLETAPRILQRVAASETSDFFRSLHLENGVEIREGVMLEALQGEGRVTEAKLSDGFVMPVDFVIAGIGVIPNTELAEGAGLETGNGIIVDEHCRTSDPRILAVGDCAAFPWKGQRLRLESVGNAIDHADAAANTILGRLAGYEAKPWFWSDQFGLKLQIAGLSSGHDRVVRRLGNNGAVSFWYYRGDELLAVDAMNDPRVYMAAKRLIEAGKSPPADAVENPGTDLKSLLTA